ncbi:1-deoxy-D-xylulose-5-phosphate reductoisomerase [Kocuria sp. SM24M-10]|uniref:1-deoxy-D-xylulose-5-phosphate reductoisomerase n=1 Tax=Kocuria sp. SM24M-10 TaxID=1660349 RepID=UPI0009E21995|nr:1-deoxy-D-xylulose-5-phosphate reductoisomerase [Kocuria sp. SM24M-10]
MSSPSAAPRPQTTPEPTSEPTPELRALAAAGPRRIVVLGSTGSIGTQALDVVRAANRLDGGAPFRVVALAAGRGRLPLLAEQAVETRAAVVATSGSGEDAQELARRIGERAAAAGAGDYRPEILHGPEAATAAAAHPEADLVLNGITGSIGLAPTLAALRAGHRLALANKESLIAGGALVKEAAAASGRPDALIPVDSEHSALAQALRGGSAAEVDRLVLTASGGPFRGRTRAELEAVTPREALRHPTWDMGVMVTTNSASMVNKALEVLEAHLLFDIPLERIDVVVHPQSVVHSMVQFVDGSTLAQASPPDMRLPIALGLAWPHRVPGAAAACDWTRATEWTFEPLDRDAFPAVELIKAAGERGGTHPAVFNAANEEAVHAFHDGRIRFPAIVDTVETVLGEHQDGGVLDLGAVLEAERWARRRAQEVLAR